MRSAAWLAALSWVGAISSTLRRSASRAPGTGRAGGDAGNDGGVGFEGQSEAEDVNRAILRERKADLADTPGEREQRHVVIVALSSEEPEKGSAAARWRSRMEWICSGWACWRRQPRHSRFARRGRCGPGR